jgi:hypothetical protein
VRIRIRQKIDNTFGFIEIIILKYSAKLNEICILYSEDIHYSMDKAKNVLVVDLYKVPVANNTRKINLEHLKTPSKQPSKTAKNISLWCAI